MKKHVGLLIIGSICLLPLILSEIQAQQTATFPSTAARSAAISIEKLKSRGLAIESMAKIDAAAKTDSLRYIDQAIKDLSIAPKALALTVVLAVFWPYLLGISGIPIDTPVWGGPLQHGYCRWSDYRCLSPGLSGPAFQYLPSTRSGPDTLSMARVSPSDVEAQPALADPDHRSGLFYFGILSGYIFTTQISN